MNNSFLSEIEIYLLSHLVRKPKHAYALAKKSRFSQSNVYNILKFWQQKGWISHQSHRSRKSPSRKIYKLNPEQIENLNELVDRELNQTNLLLSEYLSLIQHLKTKQASLKKLKFRLIRASGSQLHKQF